MADEGEPIDPQEALLTPLELFEKYIGNPKRARRNECPPPYCWQAGLDIGSDGYVPVYQILATRRSLSTPSLKTTNSFQLLCIGLRLLVRAVQGHSMAQWTQTRSWNA